MKMLSKPFLSLFFGFAFVFSGQIVSNFAQSQALDGQIEGIVVDTNSAAIPNAAITVTNVQTGATRSATSNGSGIFRFPILSLGEYSVAARASGILASGGSGTSRSSN